VEQLPAPTDYEKLTDAVREHWWRAGKRRILQHLLAKPLGDSVGALSILDAGCGDGWNLPTLAAFGEVSGLESDTGLALKCRQTYPGIEVYNLRIGDVLNADFDVICVFDVLEHIPDDANAGKWLFEHVRPGGWLFVTVPSFAFLWTSHDVKWGHHRRYTAKSLTAMLAPWFVPERRTYFNTHLFPIAVAAMLLDRLHPGASAGEGTSQAGAVNSLLREIFASEIFWLRHFNLPIGVSLFASLRRRSTEAGPLGR
jgi:2-polyprenyl-3-methyl-5-hydroxy-6-metoxy-1,4-benzoquinol methylase